MGRSAVYDPLVAAQLEKIYEKREQHIGLIVGQRTLQRDIAVYLCQIVKKEDSTEETNDSKQPKKGKGEKSNSKNSKDLQLDETWICQYAKEVTRTLPGGLDVLGIYIAAPAEQVTKLQPTLHQILIAVFKTLQKDQEMAVHSDILDRLLLHVCTASFKISCRTYDVTDTRNTPNPCEWKAATVKWHKLESHMAVDLKFPITREDGGLNIKRQIEMGLSPLFEKITNATTVINGSYVDLSNNLCAEGKKSKLSAEPAPRSYFVDLLIPLDAKYNFNQCATVECSLMFTCKGIFECRAFIHSKATVQEASKAIQQDIMRSIRARCEIHCEDLLLIDEEQQDPVLVHELPKRVYGPLGDSGLLVCDYQFHGDTASDSINAFKEILNLELTETDIQSLESSPATSTLIQPEVNEDRLSEFGDSSSSKRNAFLPAAGAALAAMAAGLSYLLLWQEP